MGARRFHGAGLVYAGVLEALVLTIERAYVDLTGGLERWRYRLVRKSMAAARTAAGVLTSNTL